jgi:hypothetical protein
LNSRDKAVVVDARGSLLDATTKGSDIDRLGIKDLIAEGTTNFAGSPKNRIFNINRALKQFQGILIAPGEEFSFVKYLGPVDGETAISPNSLLKITEPNQNSVAVSARSQAPSSAPLSLLDSKSRLGATTPTR